MCVSLYVHVRTRSELHHAGMPIYLKPLLSAEVTCFLNPLNVSVLEYKPSLTSHYSAEFSDHYSYKKITVSYLALGALRK